jgi:acetyl-CoA synthetase
MIKTDPATRSQSSDKSRSKNRSKDHRDVPDHYAALHQGFRWQVDEFFNIAEVCCSRWARAEAGETGATKRIAVCAHQPSASGTFHSYSELQTAADALSHVLAGLGVQRGDRVAIVMPQRFETAVAYMAVFQMGAVAMPLSMLFGPDALQYRLYDSEAVVAICDDSSIASVQSVRGECPALQTIIGVDGAQGDLDWDSAAAMHSGAFTAMTTRADDAAILIYTSGTTGPPKGALLAHRALIGNLPGFVCSQNWFGFSPHHPSTGSGQAKPLPQMGEGAIQAKSDGDDPAASSSLSQRERAGVRADTKWARPSKGDQNTSVFWSPADWAWTGGLMDALLPTLYFGRPIVAFNGRFTPELAFSLMQQHGVTHTFLFPTALKAMMKAYPHPREHFVLRLEGLMSAGEAVGDAVFDYCRDELGVVVNEMFGQTEINYVVGNCNRFWPARPGSMGKGYPGHQVAVIDDDGQECAVGVSGDVAVNRFDVHGDPDPIFFLGYWKKDAATQAKFTGDWCRTGDLARRDADGYLWYEGRADDVFKAAGYRIGPGEIENCLVKHPAVANAAVVPKPDKERGAVVKAYVVLAPELIAARAGITWARGQFDSDLIEKLQLHVKKMLAPYEYPKEIEFIDALPMTTTGKVQRRVLRLQEEERFKAAASTT